MFNWPCLDGPAVECFANPFLKGGKGLGISMIKVRKYQRVLLYNQSHKFHYRNRNRILHDAVKTTLQFRDNASVCH